MKNLIIDIGNSRIKTGVFVQNKLVEQQVFSDLGSVKDYAKAMGADGALVSSVKEREDFLRQAFDFPFVFFSHLTPVPVGNLYGTPDTLGLDRLAAVIGGLDWAKGPLLAIDLGTCITYDFLNENGAYMGGAISPGLQMRAKAMAAQTANLPLVEINPLVDLMGSSTVSCMQSGIYHGVMAEMGGIIHKYRQKHDDLKVFICGGDAKYFERLSKDHIFVIPNLVLHGLNRILTYNVDKK